MILGLGGAGEWGVGGREETRLDTTCSPTLCSRWPLGQQPHSLLSRAAAAEAVAVAVAASCCQSLLLLFLPLPSPPLLLLPARVTFPCLFIQTEAKSFCYNAGASPRSHLEPHLHPHPLHPLLSTSFYFDATASSCCSCCCCCCSACRRSKLRAINHFVCTLLHPFIQPERPMSPLSAGLLCQGIAIDSLSMSMCACVCVSASQGHLSRTLYALCEGINLLPFRRSFRWRTQKSQNQHETSERKSLLDCHILCKTVL